MKFILGCNYWASNAGADMWRDFDIECIDKDVKILSEYGVKHMRVFPNWRDFQPVEPVLGGGGVLLGLINFPCFSTFVKSTTSRSLWGLLQAG